MPIHAFKKLNIESFEMDNSYDKSTYYYAAS